KTRRDWTDECNARLREFFAQYTPDGRLPLRPYLAAAVRNRYDLLEDKTTPEAVAAGAKLDPKYFRILFEALTGNEPSFPLDQIRKTWRTAAEKDVDTLHAGVAH